MRFIVCIMLLAACGSASAADLATIDRTILSSTISLTLEPPAPHRWWRAQESHRSPRN